MAISNEDADRAYGAAMAQKQAENAQAQMSAQGAEAKAKAGGAKAKTPEQQGKTEAVLSAHKKRAIGRINEASVRATTARMKGRAEAKKRQQAR